MDNNYRLGEDVELKRLSDISTITMGQSPKSEYYNNDEIGKPLVQGNADIVNRFTNPRNFSSRGSKECYDDDIIMSVRAPVGAVAKSNGNYYIGRGVCSINSIYKEYIYQYLLWHEDKWNIYSTGSTFDSITSDTIFNLKVPLYSETKMNLIGIFLSNIDQVIDNYTKQKELLEQKKKHYLNVIFNDKNEDNYRLGDNEYFVKLGDVSEIRTGNKDLKDANPNGRYNFYVRSKNIEKIDEYVYDGEAVLLGGDGKISDLLHYYNGKLNHHQRVYLITSDTMNVKYMYYALSFGLGKHLMRSSAKTTVDSVRLPVLKSYKFVRYNNDTQDQIAKLLSNLDYQISNYTKQRELLEQKKKHYLNVIFNDKIK